MNDRHPSGTVTPPAPAPEANSAHYASYGQQGGQYGDFTMYEGYPATGYDAAPANTYGTPGGYDATGGYAPSGFATDPLFGDLPGNDVGGGGNAGGTGAYDAGQWSGENHQAVHYDPYAAQHQTAYETGSYDSSGAWTGVGHQQLGEIPNQAVHHEGTGQWDANAWHQADPVDGTQQWTAPTFETGAYDATAWNSDGGDQSHTQVHHQAQTEHDGYAARSHESYEQHDPYEQRDLYEQETYGHDESYAQQATTTFEQAPYEEQATAEGEFTSAEENEADADTEDGTSGEPFLLDGVEEITPVPRPSSRTAGRSGSRSRRRSPAKRSALLTIAVPSACVMGVAGIAAASVTGGSSADDVQTTAAAPDASAVQPSAANNKLDTQLENLSADADDFADRASRTQERIDLKAEQAAEKRKAAEDAARKERLRPKFALPVSQHGLSAYYGQAGVNWMSVHTGIDFPVSYGTTVMAATDGTVRTQWNSAYGNMIIVTAKDGTETWYCHLSTYKVASGTVVQAGDPIAYSGNSGNSTGPHLHFEVRPGGGSAIDPLPWLRSHGLSP
ncbi:M23 family metallopeptidase [Streptomyces fructofermentans]|uniref:M23 family metallopeptidase n=1 Tax=Streptomyces fructofermentans TaxID=152141 RepID=UPI0033D9DAA8